MLGKSGLCFRSAASCHRGRPSGAWGKGRPSPHSLCHEALAVRSGHPPRWEHRVDGEQPPPILTAQGEGATEVPSDSAWQRGLQVAQGRPSPGSEGRTL